MDAEVIEMKKPPDIRIQNAECHYKGFKDEKGLDLLRDCIKSIFEEHRTAQHKAKSKPKPRIMPPRLKKKTAE
jgi:hypothetical protein